MPTGFTCILEDQPDLPFAAFALRCARGMGVCIMQREEPLENPPPESIEVSPYYRKSLDEAYEQVRKLETMTVAEAADLAEKERLRNVELNKGFREKHENERRVYGRMLAEVEAWEPPTPEHEGLKRFMREQLTISMPSGEPYQCSETKLSGEEWLERARNRAAENLEYHAKKYREAVDSAKKGTEWLAALRASLTSGLAPEGEET